MKRSFQNESLLSLMGLTRFGGLVGIKRRGCKQRSLVEVVAHHEQRNFGECLGAPVAHG